MGQLGEEQVLPCAEQGVPLEQVSRHVVVTTDVSNGLGCCMQWAHSLWLLDRTSTTVAHQLPGVASDIAGPVEISTVDPRQFMLTTHVITRSFRPLESAVTEVAVGDLHPSLRLRLTPYSYPFPSVLRVHVRESGVPILILIKG